MATGNMKKSTIAIIFVLLSMNTVAQSDIGIPMHRYDLNTTNDTLLLDAYCTLQLDYSEANRDSSIFYGYKALALSKKLRQKFYEACTLSDLGFSLLSNGDYSNALNVLLEASKMAEDKDIASNVLPTPYIKTYVTGKPQTDRIMLLGYIKNSLAMLYGSTRNAQKQLHELLGARAIVENGTGNKQLLYTLTYNIANAYYNMNAMDSAMYYQRKALTIEESFGLNKYSGATLKNIGDVFYKKGNLDSAKKYYLQALNLIEKKNINTNYLALTQSALAVLYRINGRNDSSLYYAKAAVKNYTALGSFIEQTVESYSTLSESFKDSKQYDSAFIYMQLAKELSDSLNKKEIERLSKFQQVGFDEQLRLKAKETEQLAANHKKRTYLLLVGLGIFSIIAYILYRNNQQKQKANIVLQEQKQKVETTLLDLKAAQAQLIQSEKMASLGELTAGIAHEIQNPLNFVNNFSEVSNELIDEMVEEVDKGNKKEIKAIASDLKQNLEKINYHGKRADAIVKGMLQHSRSANNATKEPTDINALVDEYFRLAYHGLSAKDPRDAAYPRDATQMSFNAIMKTSYDETIGKINIIPQDMGRVILNLITNAFYAINEKSKQNIAGYEPTVYVSTKKEGDKTLIAVKDNGNGIPQNILDKIFQPFYTTKPTGQGTGLGLSLSYDIVKAHAGEIKVETKVGEGTTFTIILPI